MKKKDWKYLLGGVCICLVCGAAFQISDENTDWPKYGGNSGGSRYSELAQINLQNVNQFLVKFAIVSKE